MATARPPIGPTRSLSSRPEPQGRRRRHWRASRRSSTRSGPATRPRCGGSSRASPGRSTSATRTVSPRSCAPSTTAGRRSWRCSSSAGRRSTSSRPPRSATRTASSASSAALASARPPTRPDGFTPLHLAAFFGRLEAAALLVDRGADLEAPSRNPRFPSVRPLHSAIAGGQPRRRRPPARARRRSQREGERRLDALALRGHERGRGALPRAAEAWGEPRGARRRPHEADRLRDREAPPRRGRAASGPRVGPAAHGSGWKRVTVPSS